MLSLGGADGGVGWVAMLDGWCIVGGTHPLCLSISTLKRSSSSDFPLPHSRQFLVMAAVAG
jgi:hypothetical protein